jgi:hypothetical protein
MRLRRVLLDASYPQADPQMSISQVSTPQVSTPQAGIKSKMSSCGNGLFSRRFVFQSGLFFRNDRL